MEKKDYCIKLTDAELFAACEGRTARKGARGEQPGKLQRAKLADTNPELIALPTGQHVPKKSKKEKKEKKGKKDKKEKRSKIDDDESSKKSKKRRREDTGEKRKSDKKSKKAKKEESL